jgi:rhodanese-related sulfurtransferase
MTATTPTAAAGTIDVATLQAELSTNPDTLLVDVRTPGEFQVASIDGAVNLPLSQVDAHLRRIVRDAGGRMVLICQSGARAGRAATTLAGAGLSDVVVLDGGMNSWVAAGAPVRREEQAKWALERQVRLVAGGIVASSIAGSVWFPKLRFLAGGIGAGLVFAAVSNTCAMGSMLMKLPYNQGATADVEKAIQRLRG